MTPEEFDNYVGAEVRLPYDGEMKTTRVRRRAKDVDGGLHGKGNSNSILDTHEYEVEFEDGH